MRRILVFILVGFYLPACSQVNDMDKILNAFKKKDVMYIVNNAMLPFSLEAGSKEDDDAITSKTSLSGKLKRLFAKNYFSKFFAGKKIKQSKLVVAYEIKVINEDGELESESMIIFSFVKMRDGGIKLRRIALAG